MEIKTEKFTLRPWKKEDSESLAENTNNRKIWVNLVDTFPHPYTLKDAGEWISLCQRKEKQKTTFAIEIDGKAVGSIGFEIKKGHHQKIASIGYWLGEKYWGKGIVTEALKLVTKYAFETFNLVRIEAAVFKWNPASARVLEKAGYILEAELKKRVFKDGKITDELMYYLINPNLK